ncbi:TPA: hypothetical protein JLS65_004027 [Escherichia coli]|nr:hypothetical protein [Escherichia coli]
MTTFTDKEMIKEIKERIGSLDVRDNIERRAYEIALASLEAEPVAWLHSDNGLGIPAITRSKNVADSWLSKGWYVQPLYIAKPVPVVPDARPSLNNGIVGFDEGWNACRAAMLQSGNFRESKNSSTNNFREIPEASTSSPVTPALLPGGFTIEEAKELHEDLVRSHISKALSGEKMKKKDRDADLRWIHGVIVQAAWFVKASLEQNALSGNSPVTPDGWVIVPKKLTAENGAKGVLSGEFSETTFISCPECFGDDDCDTCDGSGRIEIKVPVTWTTIKSIWDKGIAYFAAEPPQEVNRG